VAEAIDIASALAKTVNAMAHSILIVEDDDRIANLVAKNLEAAGLSCHRSADGEQALVDIDNRDPDLIVLDLMLPGVDGLEIARRVRRHSQVPILMLTARADEADKVLGFEIGADDYLTKPFSPRELVARVRALLRRSLGGVRDEVLTRGALRIDVGRREVWREESPIEVTTLEFDLLHFLAARPGRVFARDELLRHVWGDERIVDDRSIDSLVSRLRRKLELDPAKPIYVQTVWGAGYRFADPGS